MEIFSGIWAVIHVPLNHSSTVKPIFYNPSLFLSLSPSHCRCGTLGTVCAESCEYRTMTGWTKLTTNEITLWECDTPRVGGGYMVTPHFSLLGLWQADLQAGLDSVGTVGRVSTPGRPVYIELTVPSQTHWRRQVLVRGSCPAWCVL